MIEAVAKRPEPNPLRALPRKPASASRAVRGRRHYPSTSARLVGCRAWPRADSQPEQAREKAGSRGRDRRDGGLLRRRPSSGGEKIIALAGLVRRCCSRRTRRCLKWSSPHLIIEGQLGPGRRRAARIELAVAVHPRPSAPGPLISARPRTLSIRRVDCRWPGKHSRKAIASEPQRIASGVVVSPAWTWEGRRTVHRLGRAGVLFARPYERFPTSA